MRRLVVFVVTAALAFAAVPTVSAQPGVHSPNLKHISTLSYGLRYGMETPFGTDIEFVTIKGRDYALGGTYTNGLQIIDITNPRRPRPVATYDCAISQGDVQVFRQGKRVLVAYAADDYVSSTLTESQCFEDVGVKEVTFGTFIIDITDPKYPKTVSFIKIPAGSHNQTIHPSGRFLYNSNADLTYPSGIEVFDIYNPRRPRLVTKLPLLTGIESHDITFSSNGKRAYVAALTHTLILDTSVPRKPRVLGRIIDPAINIHHQSDPVTITDPILGKRTFLVVTDELAGAAGNAFCPGGGLHIYDITGELELLPVKVGFWNIPEVRLATDNLTCTSHVLRLYPKQKLMTIAWYDAGVRVVDISGLVGVSLGVTPEIGNIGLGMKEIGYYSMPDANTWSAKAYRFEKNGSFYLFGSDMNRGLDIYHFDAKAPKSGQAGTWLTPAQILAKAKSLGIRPVSKSNAPVCLLFKYSAG